MIRLVLAGVAMAACGSDKAVPDAPHAIDAMHVVDTAPPIDAAPCNTLTAPTGVPEMNVASAAPAPMGGTLATGTYVLTALNVYVGTTGTSGPNGNTMAAKTTNDGTHYTYLQDELVGTTHSVVATAGTFTIDATAKTITTQEACPSTQGTVFGYDATSTSLTLYTQGGIIVNGFVFALQP